MLGKSTLLALTAVAALGLALGTANAKPGGPGNGNKGPGMGNPGIIKPIGKPIYKPYKPYWHVHVHRRHYWYAAPVTYAVSRPAVAGPCTCLSKEYTPEGAVLFKDRCTNEMAMNPPEQPAPQQTGMIDQQPQAAQYSQQYVQPTPAR